MSRKLYSLSQSFPKSASLTTGGPRDYLMWSANHNKNQYLESRGALKCLKWTFLGYLCAKKRTDVIPKN
jgi:hypothetical protein